MGSAVRKDLRTGLDAMVELVINECKYDLRVKRFFSLGSRREDSVESESRESND
jgi:hypothetical protein